MAKGGDSINVGDISRSKGIAIGRGAQAHVTEGVAGESLAQLLDAAYRRIAIRPEDPDVDKSELTDTIDKLKSEAAKGEQANPNRVERWLTTLADVAPDVLDVTLAALTNPAAGVAAAVRNVAKRFTSDSASSEEKA